MLEILGDAGNSFTKWLQNYDNDLVRVLSAEMEWGGYAKWRGETVFDMVGLNSSVNYAVLLAILLNYCC